MGYILCPILGNDIDELLLPGGIYERVWNRKNLFKIPVFMLQ